MERSAGKSKIPLIIPIVTKVIQQLKKMVKVFSSAKPSMDTEMSVEMPPCSTLGPILLIASRALYSL